VESSDPEIDSLIEFCKDAFLNGFTSEGLTYLLIGEKSLSPAQAYLLIKASKTPQEN
jgi:hypothetical protein